jgi:hypothetical protein
MVASAVVLVGAPVLAMGVMAGSGPADAAANEVRSRVQHAEPASPADHGISPWARVLPLESLTPTPGAAVLAGLGLVVGVARRRG